MSDVETRKSIKEAFELADVNGDGLISKEELREAFHFFGDLTDDEFDVLFAEADTEDQGRLSYSDFVDWVMGDEDGPALFLGEISGDEGGESEDEGSDWTDIEEDDDEEWDDMGDCEEGMDLDEPGEPLEHDGDAFEDEDFPADASSLGNTEGDTASGVTGEESQDWLRLGGEEGACLFKGIQPNDVIQGTLGNCWFLAACASVASYPGWVRQTFGRNAELTADGRYEVRLFNPAKKSFQYVTVSDEVPGSEDGTPSFSSVSVDSEIWPCLLEKAFAKTCGSYAKTEAGWPVWGMVYLCGGTGEEWSRQEDGDWARQVTQWSGEDDSFDREFEGFDTKNSEGNFLCQQKLWKALLAYTKKNFPLCCSIGNELEDMKGLISGHAYSLTAVRAISSHGKNLRMCKVRNPHGETEWTGKWSDSSDMWASHPNVKKELKFKAKEDGSFWMSFKDFCKFFDTLSVNKRSLPLDDCHPDKLRAIESMA